MENYEVISNIGQGSFGVVSKIKRKSDGKILVWKELNYGKMSEREKQQLVSEVNILRELRHPNIVRYYDRIIDKKNSKIYIVMEYCEGGDMRTLLKKCKKENDFIAEDVIWKIFTQIMLALLECHKHKGGKILHRDLKPANIFLDSQNNIKLGDFGLSRLMNEQSMFAYTHVGTPYYMSPEQINESKYNEKSDIWSTGCLLYEIAALKPPFEAKNHLALAIKIKAGKFDRLPIRYSEDLQKLIEIMLNINPERRPDVDQLFNIPQVSIRKKERKLKDKLCIIKQKENDMKKKEEMIKTQEQVLLKKEEELKKLEVRLLEYEKYVKKLENENNNVVNNNNNNNINTSNSVNTSMNLLTNDIQMQYGGINQYKPYKKLETWKEKPNGLINGNDENINTSKTYTTFGLNLKSHTINEKDIKNLGFDTHIRLTTSASKKLLNDITNLIEKKQIMIFYEHVGFYSSEYNTNFISIRKKRILFLFY